MSSRKKRGREEASRGPSAAAEGDGAAVSLPCLAAALALIFAGYWSLAGTAPSGEGIRSVLAALFLLAGYLLVPAALLPLEPAEKAGSGREPASAPSSPRPMRRVRSQ